MLVFFAALLVGLASQIVQAHRQLHSQLKRIDRSIWSLSTSQYFNPILERKSSIKFPKLIEQEWNLTMQALESMKMPSRKEASYPVALRLGRHFYSVAGEEILKFEGYQKDALVSSSRNDHLCVAVVDQRLDDSQQVLAIMEAETKQKNCFLKPLINITHIPVEEQQNLTNFVVGSHKTRRTFTFGSSSGNIYNYRKNGSLQTIISASESPIFWMGRMGAHTFYLSATDVGYLTYATNQKPALTRCELSEEPIESIFNDEASAGTRFFAKTAENIILYQLSPICKPMRILPIPTKSSVHPLGDLLIVHNQFVDFYFNLSSPNYSRHLLTINRPLNRGDADPTVSRDDNRIQVVTYKKSQNTHVLLVRTFDKNTGKPSQEVQVYHYLTEDEPSSFNFKGLKAPIFVISIAIVFYYSYKVRNKGDSAESGEVSQMLKGISDPELKKKLLTSSLRQKENNLPQAAQEDPKELKGRPAVGPPTSSKREPTNLERHIIEKLRELEQAKRQKLMKKQN